jgi:beta-galactosidase
MRRRDFIKRAGTLAAGILAERTLARASDSSITDSSIIDSSHADSQNPASQNLGPTGRLILSMNRNWRFSRSAKPEAHERHFDDSAFERVVIPHANIGLPWHSFDDKDYEFVSVYRRRFKLPQAAQGHRVFVDFEGVMTASTVWLNGTRLGEYKGGYTPFSFELTPHLDFQEENVIAVEVDSTERADIPPFGHQIDYLTFGGIYREVALRIVPSTFIENIFARTLDVLTANPKLKVDCFLQHLEPLKSALTLEVSLRDGDRIIASGTQRIAPAAPAQDPARHTVPLEKIGRVELWDVPRPKLYSVQVRLLRGSQLVDEDTRRIGFREARFTDHGFELNGKVVKLRGLDRHQTFPFVGQAMPGRVQRRDAQILRQNFKCNIVRTSHYPQSRHFIDACDEVGLLVLEEIPGWQHIGDEAWKELSVDNVRRMIRRDWNHPSIILWGARINESRDDHDFYVRTNAVAHELDPTRPTGGIRNNYASELLEDVFTMNDFGFPLRPPNHLFYLNTEFVGHTYPTKTIDNTERLTEHTLRHARIHNQLASSAQYAGGIGWCAFDYNTHFDFGSGDRVCYHGVADIFREPKPAAGFYKSQCDPDDEIVLEPAFRWARGDESIGFSTALICSNCDQLKLYIDDKRIAEIDPDRNEFGNLRHPPFILHVQPFRNAWGDLRIEGYIQGKQAIVKKYSGKGVDQQFVVAPDDTKLFADGADATRVVLRVTDEFGAIRSFANDAIVLDVQGPAYLIGDNPFALVGGSGAVWLRAKEEAGNVRLTATHPVLGHRQVDFEIVAVPAEAV